MQLVLGIIIGTILAVPVLALFTGGRIHRLEATINDLRRQKREEQ